MDEPQNTAENIKFLKERLVTCACPPPEEPIKPMARTPFDRYGYVPRCCGYIPLRVAAVIICAMSFFWLITELVVLDKYAARLFPDKENGFEYFKYCYMALVICFGIACLTFMVGIKNEKYKLVSIYVWAGLVFHCIYIAIYITGVIIVCIRNKITKRFVVRVVFGFVWNLFYFYLLMVVNSYRIHLYVWNT